MKVHVRAIATLHAEESNFWAGVGQCADDTGAAPLPGPDHSRHNQKRVTQLPQRTLSVIGWLHSELKGEEGSTGADGEYQSSPAANSTTGSGSGGTSSGAFPVVQSLDYSCVAAAACNLIYLKTGKVVSEADAMKEIARLGGFSEDLFKTTGINRDQQKAGVIPFLAAHGITAKMSSITGTNLAESNLSSALQSGEPFIVRSSAFMTNPGHALVMQYDSANSNFRVINSAGVQNASGGMDYDYRMTPGEAWDAVKYISHWEAIWNVWSSGLFLKHLEKVPK